MSADAKTAVEQRHRHYVDKLLQGRLVVGLVVFEVLLFGVAMFVLYQDLSNVVEQSMYRAHATEHRTLPLLLSELLRIGAVLIAINVVAVIGGTRLWRTRVDAIVETLERLLLSVHALDFRGADEPESGHEVLQNAGKWRQRERDRCEKIRAVVESLDSNVDSVETQAPEAMQAALQRLRELLT